MRDRRVLDDRQNPLILRPHTEWTPPDSLPNLRNIRVAIDTETKDEGLQRDIGPGWPYHMGYVAGISVAWGHDRQIYVPLRHPETNCHDHESAIRWISGILESCECCFHNAAYDIAWLREAGVTVWPGRIHDTQYAAVLLDENWDRYSLDECCHREGLHGKDEALLDDALAAWGVPLVGGSRRHGIWRLPAAYVGPYAEQDARATLDLADRLLPRITASGLTEAYQLEIDLIEVVYQMRLRGVRVSHQAADEAQHVFREARDQALKDISDRTLVRVSMSDMHSADALARVFDAEGIQYPRTPTRINKLGRQTGGMPSFQKAWLEGHDHWLPGLVRQARRMNDLAEKFVGTYILENTHQGRIHAEIHQLRDETGGARSYRFSYSNPPLQQMPARFEKEDKDEERLIRAVRAIFLPESGEFWGALDYAAQEPRFAVHFASLCHQRGADRFVRYFCDDPKADVYKLIMELAHIDRWPAKIIWLGLLYGMGMEKLARSLHLTDDEAAALMKTFHREVPWIRGITDFCSNRAQARGVIRLVDGAQCHFDHWVPRGQRTGGLRINLARQRWPGQALERVGTHKAANRLIQGSAARQTKRAMLAAHRAGVPPILQMHDEIDFSISQEAQWKIARDAMVETTRLVVPVRVDCEFGRDWGHASQTWDEIKEAA